MKLNNRQLVDKYAADTYELDKCLFYIVYLLHC